MTKVFGVLAWAAVAVIAIFGIARGQDIETLRPAVHLDRDRVDPDGPADVRAGDAVVGGAAPGRGQGGRQVAHRRRDARRDDGHQQRQDRHADDERDDGDDDAGRRRLVHDRGRRLREVRRDPRRRPGRRRPTSPDWRSGLCCAPTPPSPTTSRSSATRPRRPSWCSPPRWASTPRRPAATLPRRAEVPFDSEYKFMATFHDRPDWMAGGVLQQPHFVTREGRSRRRHRAVRARRCGTASRCRSARSATRSSPPTGSCPSVGCGCWRSPPATSTTPR